MAEEKNLEEEMNLDENETEETIDSVKEKLAKAESDRDNYKKENEKYRKEEKETKVEEKEEEPDLEDVTQKQVQKALETQNEKEGQEEFLTKYPALKDPERFKQVLAQLPASVDKSSPRGVTKALEKALLLYKYESGDEKSTEVDLSEFATVTKKGSKAEENSTPKVNDSTIEMGTQFRHGAEDLTKEDDSPYAEIKI